MHALIRGFTHFIVKTHKLTNLLSNGGSKWISIFVSAPQGVHMHNEVKVIGRDKELFWFVTVDCNESETEECLEVHQPCIIASLLWDHHFVQKAQTST